MGFAAKNSARKDRLEKPVTEQQNNNNEHYISSVDGDSQDSARDVGNAQPVDGASNAAPLIQTQQVPTLDHEVKGAYQLASDKNQLVKPTPANAEEAELAHSQTGSEGGLTLSLPL